MTLELHAGRRRTAPRGTLAGAIGGTLALALLVPGSAVPARAAESTVAPTATASLVVTVLSETAASQALGIRVRRSAGYESGRISGPGWVGDRALYRPTSPSLYTEVAAGSWRTATTAAANAVWRARVPLGLAGTSVGTVLTKATSTRLSAVSSWQPSSSSYVTHTVTIAVRSGTRMAAGSCHASTATVYPDPTLVSRLSSCASRLVAAQARYDSGAER